MCHTSSVRTRAELLATGMTRRAIDRALRAGSLIRLRRGVYADADACEPVIRAALLGGPPACVSAARHHGLWILADPEPLHVGLKPSGHRHANGEVSHWDRDTVDAFGLPAVAQTLRQVLRCRGVEEFLVALESALHQNKIQDADLTWLEAHTNAAGREAIAFARRDAESGLETLVRWRLRHWGIDVRTQQGVVSVGRVDLLIGERLIVEVDGAENHAAPDHRHRDLVRDAHAAAWGFVTLRFDYAMVVHDWPTVELAIRAHVDRGLHRTLS
ncbi:type IV toxin-antitoxin system AbiEi family antitoxin domain-containing protein [Microbacterium testaceum]|uniref:type IV toxin-antitoxin system AbiEi family antitoxin domain-containing protein n=1 Tax=Microbacterium testaceum TaxID=2033 RepID=UPI00342C0EDE